MVSKGQRFYMDDELNIHMECKYKGGGRHSSEYLKGIVLDKFNDYAWKMKERQRVFHYGPHRITHSMDHLKDMIRERNTSIPKCYHTKPISSISYLQSFSVIPLLLICQILLNRASNRTILVEVFPNHSLLVEWSADFLGSAADGAVS